MAGLLFGVLSAFAVVAGLLSPLGLALFAALGLAFGVVGCAVGARGLGAMVLGGLEL